MKKYNPDIFNHFDEEVEEDNPDSFERCSFILETGFNLFIVLSNFLEINKDDSDAGGADDDAGKDNLLQ